MDLLPDLITLGFTEYEARVYLALLQDHPANGYQLSKKAGIPRSMVYEALGRLHSRGAILKTGDEKSTLYRPLPPDLLLNRYDREHRQLLDKLHNRLQSMYSTHKEDLLWSISGEEAIFNYSTQMISRAKQEIMIVLNDLALDQLQPVIISVCERGLNVGVLLTGIRKINCGQIAHHPPLESELQGLGDMLVVAVDGKECLIASVDQSAMTATITTNANLVYIARQFIWMELFTQRIFKQLGSESLQRLKPDDRHILENFTDERMTS